MSQGEGNLRRVALAICAASFAALSLASAARADIRYASPAGGGPSGDGQCALANPCNLQAAVEDPAVDDGDIVRLLSGGGGYTLGTSQLVIDDNITIEPNTGLPRQTLASVFTGSGGAVSVTAPGAVVRSITINHGADNDTYGLSLPVGTAERVYVVSNGFLACAVTSGALRDSVCFLTAAAEATAIGAVGTSVGGNATHQSTLRNVTAISKEPNAPGLVLSAAVGADLTMNASNVIAESPSFDAFASAGDVMSTATISLANSNYPTFDAAGAGGTVTPNTIAGNQATPPLFTNFAANVFSQAPGSPTIDAGVSDPLLGALDIDGQPRILQGKPGCPNALPDIGAYEAPAVTPANCTPPATTPATQKRKRCRKGKRKQGQAAAAKRKRCKKRKKR